MSGSKECDNCGNEMQKCLLCDCVLCSVDCLDEHNDQFHLCEECEEVIEEEHTLVSCQHIFCSKECSKDHKCKSKDELEEENKKLRKELEELREVKRQKVKE